MNGSARFKVADERLGVFTGDTPTQPERARRAAAEGGGAFVVGADPAAPPAPEPAPTRERATTEGLLSLLMLDHNTIASEGDTHESATELDRVAVLRGLESLAMTATGALHATTPRLDLVASASKDAGAINIAAFDAYTRSSGPLAKTLAGEMMRAASTSLQLARSLADLPGGTKPVGPPKPPPATTGPVAADDQGDGGELAPAPEPRAPRRAGIALAGSLALLVLLATAKKGGRR